MSASYEVAEVLAAAEQYGNARQRAHWREALGSAELLANRRAAARAWRRLSLLAGADTVSLIRGFNPRGRLPCGCPKEGAPNPVPPFRWQHDGEAHDLRARYDDAYFDALAEAREIVRGGGECATRRPPAARTVDQP